LSINGPLSNTGTIEADSGTLLLNANSISQVSGNTLSAGTWSAINGAALLFPNGTTITNNNATLNLDGIGASIDGLGGLNSNSGSISLTNGATFTTAGDFSNSGSLTAGAGSTLSVAGNYTQTSTGVLNVQLGGTPASGQFGQVAVQSAANLDGNLNVSLVNGFTPSSGQDFPVMTFGSASGSFATVTGLGTALTESLNPTSLDLVGAAPSSADLQLTQVSAPTTATAGQSITVTWQASNAGSQPATGSWQDSVYLSPTPTITSSSILLGAVAQSGGLAAGGSYNSSWSGAVPALPPGNYYVLVQADSLYQVPDSNRTNNTRVADTGQLAVSVPALTPGTPTSGTFTAANQDQYYQVTVPAGGSLVVSLASTASSGATALYISQGTLPTPYSYQEAAVVANQPNQTVTVPQVLTAGTYYILAHSIAGNAATSAYTLTVTQGSAVTVSAPAAPYTGGNGGSVTIEIDGTNFTPQTTASLTLGATTIAASAIDFVNASQIFATFNLSGAAAGSYTLTVQQGSQSVMVPTPFQVTAASPGTLNVVLSTPQYVRPGRTSTITVTYSNPTSNDMVAPLLTLDSTNSNVFFSTPDDPNSFLQQAQVLAVAPSGPAGILRPGQSGQLTLTLLSNDTVNNDSIPIHVGQLESGQTIPWATLSPVLQPPTMPTAAWNVIFNNIVANVGPTTDAYNAALAQAATYLGGLRETTAEVSNVGRLWTFLGMQANASFPTTTLTSAVDASLPTPGRPPLAIGRTFVSTIDGRYTPGIFGLGWVTSWEAALSTDSSGNVTINSGGSVGFFFHQPNGTYLNTDGEYGTLTNTGGVYTYTDAAGTQHVFLANGQLNYVQDTNGNRITLGYNAQNQLVTLTYSNPADPTQATEQLTLTYSGQGLVSQVADGTGNTWAYQYDSAGHLLSVTGPGNLTTSYTYDTGSNAETANALLSITYSDGSQRNFTYDPATGRLTGTSQNGGANPIAFGYPGEAEVTTTDAANDQFTAWFNDTGTPSRTQDARGGISNSLYDPSGNLIAYTNAARNSYQCTNNLNGNLMQVVNPLGQTVQMPFGAFSNLTAITDAGGDTTQYGYGTTGNLLNITYPDGSKESFTYDPLGNLSETVLRNGDPISYQYNSQGLVTRQTFADGSSNAFTYDAHSNLLTAQTFNAAGALTGTTTLTYNAAKELLSITYPYGRHLSFIYDPTTGQRTQSVDQNGFTVNYSYDALGRLSQLTDGSGNLIVAYTYNSVGQLAAKQNGNSTSTIYAYDATGNLTSLVNYAADGRTVNSSFTYTYNLLGQVTSVTDVSGATTTYGYDATGQLTQVVLPGGQTITYIYNAAGDRTEVINGSTTTSYSSNADNEITQVGSAVYTYDANGNLHTVTDSNGMTTYTYNDFKQLVSIAAPDGSTTTFQYSPLGFLVGTSTTTGATTSQTNYLIDPTGLGNVVGSYDGSGALIADYTYGLGLVNQAGPSGGGYYDFDANGNTAGITGVNGSYVNQYGYLPFGETITVSAALPNPFTFAGRFGIQQVGNNLLYMRARYYSGASGTFTSADPLQLSGGDTNFYRYAGNDPENLVDPSGLRYCWYGPFGENPIVEGGPRDFFGLSIGASTGYSAGLFLGPSVGASVGASIGLGAAAGVGPGGYVGPSLEAGANAGLASVGGAGAGVGIHAGLGAGVSADVLQLSANVASYGASFGYGFGYSRGSTYGLIIGIGTCPDPTPLSSPNLPSKPHGAPNQSHVRLAIDPNSLVGPAGFGSQGFLQPGGTWPYTVDFENDGSAPAQTVTVTEQLDSNLDWSTFQLGSFGFGPVNVTIPAGLTQYQTTVAYQNTDGTPLNVDVALDFNVQTGLLTVTFTSLDPLTGQVPTGVFNGFLPPDDSSHVGEGYVQYTVQPKAGLTTGATVNQQATVVFDTNAPISTAPVVNTIDAGAPTSSVTPLPAQTQGTTFTVSWSGQDDPGGSGIASYDVFVSDNGGPFTLFQQGTTQTSATFTGQVGHTYGFYSVATDNVGNRQATPSAAQATTTVIPPPPVLTGLTPPAPVEGTATGSVTLATFTDSDPNANDFTAVITWGDQSTTTVSGTSGGIVAIAGQPGTFAVLANHAYAEEGNATLSVQVTDANGLSSSTAAAVAVTDAPLTITNFTPPSATEGVGTGAVTLATFSDSNSSPDVNDYTATVNWGDGHSDTLTAANGGIVQQANGSFSLVGAHTFAEESSGLTFSVQISDKGGAATSTSATVPVADAPLSAVTVSPRTATAGQALGASPVTVASFHDANLGADAADFSAVINWGDGSTSSLSGAGGSVVAVAGQPGLWQVLGNHTYASSGNFSLSVQVTDVGLAAASGMATVSVAAAASGQAPAPPPFRSLYRTYGDRLYRDLTGQPASAQQVSQLALQGQALQLAVFALLPSLTGQGSTGVYWDMALAGFAMALAVESNAASQQQPLPQGTPGQIVAANYQQLGLPADTQLPFYAAVLGLGVPDSLVLALIAGNPSHQLEMAGVPLQG
jgi:RHS repeat-associated protein/uncharacterized repeat protein (TIGR01451 family)